jgi:hypothetical protein
LTEPKLPSPRSCVAQERSYGGRADAPSAAKSLPARPRLPQRRPIRGKSEMRRNTWATRRFFLLVVCLDSANFRGLFSYRSKGHSWRCCYLSFPPLMMLRPSAQQTSVAAALLPESVPPFSDSKTRFCLDSGKFRCLFSYTSKGSPCSETPQNFLPSCGAFPVLALGSHTCARLAFCSGRWKGSFRWIRPTDAMSLPLLWALA